MSNRTTIRHIGFALLVAVLLVACATVDSDDGSEHVGRVSSALGVDVCLGGADTPSLVPKWSQIYLGRWASSSVVSGTVQNTDTIDIPVRIDLRMAGADARVISTTLWQGTLARGSVQTVSFRLDTLPIRSYNVASAAEIVATATGTPRGGDSVYSDPLYAIYDPNRGTFSLSGSTPPQPQYLGAPATFSAAVTQLANAVVPSTRRANGGTALRNGLFVPFTEFPANGSDAFVHAQSITLSSADSAKLSSLFEFNAASVNPNYAASRVCARYGGIFVDDGKGESVTGSTLPARFARAFLGRANGPVEWSGVLDAGGCTPVITLVSYSAYMLVLATDLQDNALGGSHNVKVRDSTGTIESLAIGFDTQNVLRPSWSPSFDIRLGGYGSGDHQTRVAGVIGQTMLLPFGSIPPGDYLVRANERCNGNPASSTACYASATSTLFIGPNLDGTHNSQYKFVIAHEFGHAIQDRASGTVNLDYSRTVTDESGPCGCGFVSDATDRAHCLQSQQRNGAVETEAFAHYVAANTWNVAGPACTFVYYKSFRDDSGAIVKPPLAKSCSSQVHWMENHCSAASRGVEWDWLNFFRGSGASGGALPMSDVHAIFRQACGGTCSSANEPSFLDLQNAALAFYGGSQFDARYAAFRVAGVNFGVNH